VLVYFGETITVELQGQTWRRETCQYCGSEFHYQLWVAATGVAVNPYFIDSYGSPGRAEENARSQLDHALRHGVLPVPCPHCSKYQEYMVPALRANRFLWMKSAGRFILGLGAALLAISLLMTVLIVLPADKSRLNKTAVALLVLLPVLPLMASMGLFLARRRRLAAYNPNAEAYARERRQIAANRALKPEEFERLRIPTPPPGLVRLGQPPRSRQLVGMNCVRCGERIPDELDSRFCRGCGWPVHNRCAVSAEGGCTECGAGAPQT
jgi:hypothetical protein